MHGPDEAIPRLAKRLAPNLHGDNSFCLFYENNSGFSFLHDDALFHADIAHVISAPTWGSNRRKFGAPLERLKNLCWKMEF